MRTLIAVLRVQFRANLKRGLVAILASGCLAFAPPAYAQSGAAVSGNVVDETGGVLPGVIVDLRAGSVELTAVTDDTGSYRFADVPPGTVEVSFKLINFSIVRRPITVVAGRSLTANAVPRLSLTADVVVTGTRTFRNIADLENPAENLVGIASAASQGAITAKQLEARPIMRPAEVLEAVPGLIASQHSGEGKANQYYLRGFNLDHGSDFAVAIAGVPVNLPTQAHFHGYADTNILIPELVSGVQFKKGPYFADDGDFSAAGSSNVNYVNRLDRPIVSLSGGGQGWGRCSGAASPRIGAGHLLVAVEAVHNDGPWTHADDFQKLNGIVRYSRGDTRNGLVPHRHGIHATGTPPIRFRVSAPSTRVASRVSAISIRRDGGRTFRYSLVADMPAVGREHVHTRDSLRVPVRPESPLELHVLPRGSGDGDQREQEDRRTVSGGRVTYRRLGSFARAPVESGIGAQLRHDAIGNTALYRTVLYAAHRNDPRGCRVARQSVGVFGQSEMEWSRTFRTTVGLRGDVYRFDVDSRNPLNSGKVARRPREPEVRRGAGTVEEHRALRQRRARVSQQRRARHHHHGGSEHG